MKVTSENVWPPGFRFHPTDEELVLFYLKRKICKKKIKFDIISETDVYKWDPEELPGQSLLKSGDRQWFFFSPRDRKYPNGARSNRATRHGYWKATGKDRNVTCHSRNVGVKKTLVFYRGRAPTGERTDWVMHEYTLDEEELQRCQNISDYYALYKVFKKSGPGPKNGEQYGAPFKEEDWVDDEDLVDTKTVEEIASKELKEVATAHDVKPNGQVPLVLDDFEEFIKQLADEPLPTETQINYTYEAPQVVGEEEAQSTLMNASSREVMFSEPISVCNEQASFDFTQSASSNLQLYDTSEVTSAPNNCEQVLQIFEEDFLEMDDLIGPQPTVSTPEVENLQFNEFDGLSELDLFHDAALFLQNLEPVDQEENTNALANNLVNQVDHQFQPQSVVNQVDNQLQPNLIVNQMNHQLEPNSMGNQTSHQLQPNLAVSQVDYELQPHSLGAEDISSQQWMHDLCAEDISSQPWMHDQLTNFFTPTESTQGILCPPISGSIQQSANHPTEANPNQDQSGQEVGGATSRFASSLWAFVESIPTTPASASESPLVNRAFERMSSFSRMRITARNPNVAGGDAAALTRRQASSNRGFLLLSILGALCAILWMLMGTMRVLGSCISS
ncbi:NAC domain-containing protein 17 [Citrus sinensis]|nr:NAC domain-containing protein 17 isoform X1 [Citrus sinensis]KAH9692011.1 NAC domain-containing protein 17 [Citrus sinensis]